MYTTSNVSLEMFYTITSASQFPTFSSTFWQKVYIIQVFTLHCTLYSILLKNDSDIQRLRQKYLRKKANVFVLA